MFSRTAAGLFFIACLLASVARADSKTIFAPIGGAALHAPAGRIACPAPDANGWTISPDGQSIRPPSAEIDIGLPTRLVLADVPEHCPTSTEGLLAIATGPLPAVNWNSVSWDVDAGQISLRGQRLRGAILHWSLGEKSGEDRCSTPATTGGQDQCFFAIDRTLPVQPEQLTLQVLPAGDRPVDGATLYDAQGRPTIWDPPHSAPDTVLARLLPQDAAADVASGIARIPLMHPEAVSDVDCEDASCEIDSGALVIRGEHGDDNVVGVRFLLRPHVTLRSGSPAHEPTLSIPIQRCPIDLASKDVFQGLPEQRVAVRVGGRCADDASLQFSTSEGAATVVSEARSGNARYVLVEVGRLDQSELILTVRQANTTVGVIHARAVEPPTSGVRLELPGNGPINFIPTNRAARVLFPPAPDSLVWSVRPLRGFYEVNTDPSLGTTVRGVDGVTGSVAIRLALRDSALPGALASIDLAELSDPVVRAIQVARVPVSLGTVATGTPLVEMLCGDGEAHVQELKLGATSYIPFRAHDTCRLVLHAERLPAENGPQTLRLTVDVTGADGGTKSDAHVDKRVTLRPGGTAENVYISGIDTPFDRARVKVAVETESSLEAGSTAAVGSEAQWTTIFGTSKARIYATTTFPSGLFRVSDEAHSGILSLNAGALLRAVFLSPDGQESPIGAEGGVLWMGIPGDGSAAASSHGQVAIVLGLGIGVPIANISRSAQTSINLHAWLEYDVSRAVLEQTGSSWGFIFGPSLTIGDIGRNF